MQLTSRILDAMQDGVSSSFIDLLIHYGRWACYLGCSGYATGKQSVTAWIDDTSALIIDKCFGRLKSKLPAIWYILCMFYVKDMDELDIVITFKKRKRGKRRRQGVKRGRNFYGYDPAYADTLYSCGPKEILLLKKRGDQLIFNYLLELKNGVWQPA